MGFATQRFDAAPVVAAPDGSRVRVLVQTERGSMAHFTLPPHAVSRAVVHRTVDEVWYCVAGHGRMWRRSGGVDEITELAAGVSLAIPCGMCFQFRADSAEPLRIVGVTMPPWPGEDEACPAEGPWSATV